MIDLLVAQVSNAWWYVAAAYIIIFGGVAFFVGSLSVRLRRARRELDQLS